MSEIFSITLPIFLTIGLGYLSVQLKVFARGDMRVLGQFVLFFALPALIVRTFTQRTVGEIFDGRYLLLYALSSLIVLLAGFVLMRRRMKMPVSAAAISALGMAGPNSGYVGYPLLLLMIGPVAGVVLALNMFVENVIVMPLALAMAEAGMGKGLTPGLLARHTLGRMVRSPMLIAIAVGLTISLSGLKLPAPVARTIDMLAMAAGPIALFVIGGTLHGLSLKGMKTNIGLIVTGKLVVHPLVMAGLLLVLPISDPVMRQAALISAAVPMLGIFPLLGMRFGQEKLCAAALLGGTVASFFTLSALVALLKAS